MPSPVSAARECLTAEATRALDEAVSVARRRCHAQTTSIHALSAFLALPSSALREACARARNPAYSARLQIKALELSVGVALDRLPSSKTLDEPPISNSLMAAIKRSQANQRRHPECFHLQQQQQQQQQQSSSVSCVRVELQHLILSILDDPVVSRVLGDAGFRSRDINLAILRPPPSLVQYPRSPLFLCNLMGSDSGPGRRSFNFPFSGFSEFSGSSDGDENCRRIGEILMRKKRRNPLLIGVCSSDALRCFSECVERGKGGVLPVEISGLKFICIEKELLEFITESGRERLLDSRFEELGHMAENCSGPGVVVSFGDFAALAADGSADAVSYVVSQLSRLLELHHGNLWLMGTAMNYETYLKLLNRFPSIEKDWDLQLLPITSLGSSVGGFYSRPSLTGSFVPFGGFFSTPSDLKGPLSSTFQSLSLCHLCNEKYEQEVSAFLKGGCTVSVADQHPATFPSWLQTTELGTNKGLDVAKAKDNGTVLDAKVMELHKKWNDICQRFHRFRPLPEADIHNVESQVPGVAGFVRDKKGNADNHVSSGNASPDVSGCEIVFPCMSMDSQKNSSSKPDIPISVVSKAKNEKFLTKTLVRPSNSEHLEAIGLCSSPYPRHDLEVPNDHASPSSVTSVTTDLGLGTLYASTGKELKKSMCQVHKERLQDLSGCSADKVNVVNGNISNHLARHPSSGPDLGGQFDPRDFKALWRVLTEKVGRQDEAIWNISQTVARCRTGNERRRGASLKRDIWLAFLGPDMVGKKKIAVALAEIVFGSKENMTCVDLSSQDGMIQSNTIFDRLEINGYDLKFRGKTVVDYIAGELRKKPLSVVFLENLDKADPLAQNSLSQAIKTGKLSDSYGREVGISNAIFVTTSRVTKGSKMFFSDKESINFSEERILGAKGWQMQILIGYFHGDTSISNDSNASVTLRKDTFNPVILNKRKLTGTSDSPGQGEILEMAKRTHKASNTYLDLNLPVEEMEAKETDYGNYDSDSISENSEAWLEDFFDHQVDGAVDFKPFDFDVLADKVWKDISESFRKTIGPEILLEIDPKVMEHILAAAWLSDRKRAVEDWVEQVLSKSFSEAQQRYNITARSVVKLVACEGDFVEEQAPGVCLPARIILN
ncbi:hypothetical protein HHK36_016198 [Tetracentron sinense]|uniref:Clp R domain-containing protein n=1 Tax=Tetracentron sinense TaxID=13715 RepID=A0A834Z0B6_TETSI|nr:hypothetical protein HHK36_016198 [Tetracentron sinense]